MSVRSKHFSACSVMVMSLGIAAAFTNPVAHAARGGPSAQDGFDDHQNMMAQLGIKQLRPGANPNNQSAFDEASANIYKDTMPDVLTMKDGTKVTSAAQWPRRRAEILEDFEREIYGRVPSNVPKVTWEVTDTTRARSGDTPIVTQTLVGHVDNSAYPSITVNLQASFTVPAEATTPVPIMIEFDGFGGFGRRGGMSWQQQAIAKGWGYGSINPGSIQPDNNRLRSDIIGLTNKGEPRKPDQWGALRAWGWGVSRLIDFFEANPNAKVDPKKVGIEGVSRYGKAALVTAAFDERVAVAFVASSGEGGAKLHRHIFGEAVENLTGRGGYHWMAGNFLKYGASDPCMTAADMPVDSHELIALCAPRSCFISYGILPGDPPWVDARGSFMAGVLAGPVYKLLGKKDFGTPGNYLTDPMPPVGILIGGELAWRQHEGGHTSGPNWPAFFEWVGQYIKAPPLPTSVAPAFAEPVPTPGRGRGFEGPAAPADRSVPRLDQNSQTAHAQLLEKVKQGGIDVYFEGDSITRRWGALDYPDFLAHWKQNFFGWNAADFGWGGDTVQNILWRLENGELDNVHPKAIVILAGTNNVGSAPSQGDDDPRIADVTKGIRGILDLCRKKAPEATIIVMGITPRNDGVGNPTGVMPVISRINENIAKLADGKKIRYVDINGKLADQDGKLYDGMTVDRLHLSLKGYQVWADALKPILTELLGPPAKEDHAPLPTGDPSARTKPRTETAQTPVRERVSFNADWRFAKDDPNGAAGKLSYNNMRDWVLATGAPFSKDPNFANKKRPAGNLGADVACTQPGFDDKGWRSVTLPHDWGIEGPFDPKAPGGTGKLPFSGIGWYRKHFAVPASDQGRQLYLDVDGAMSYANIWLNGQYVGGWPYGYASWQVDLTPYVKFGGENVIAIRLENPPNSSRWYPGGGIYRNVWLVKTAPVHVGHWGTYLTTRDVSSAAATVTLKVTVDNRSQQVANVRVSTQIFPLDSNGHNTGTAVADIAPLNLQIPPDASAVAEGAGTVANPRLWGPPPQQQPNRYVAVTTVSQGDKVVDTYETPFGIRTLKFDPNAGFFINGEHILLNGVCNHHDLGALGAAVNYRALQRQLEMLMDMGCNAIRTSHNPPAPELLELTDKMGFLVVDEAFDVWVRQKTPLDFHLIFPDWGEQDLRALLRRDRNCPSVILWSIGNEVGEQFTGDSGAAMAKKLSDIVHDEDPTRPTTTAMNVARATSPFAAAVDVIGLNYQGAGIRGAPGQFPAFHQALPDKFIVSSETASALSSRGEYIFPVAGGFGAAVGPNSGEDPSNHHVSAYELYYAPFGASPDKVFASQEQHPYAGGEFVWTGWDYLGEPTPFYSSRSSYSGIIDLAGFKKDRFYLYQAHWRPDFPMAHILPHWTWPERNDEITPVHVFTSGDEAELFLNGKSLGKKTKGQYEYRLRWDEVTYQPGELKVVAYKKGKEWATDVMRTASAAAKLLAKADRSTIAADGRDLAFVTITITDKDDTLVPRSRNRIRFSIEGPGEIVATDNGDPTSFESFQSKERNAFNGLCLAIVRAKLDQSGTITLKAQSEGLQEAAVALRSEGDAS